MLLFDAAYVVPNKGTNFILISQYYIFLSLVFCAIKLGEKFIIPGRVAQSVMCLATDACLTADPWVASSIPARYHTFVEIDHEIISTVILLLPLIYSRITDIAMIHYKPHRHPCIITV